MLPTATVSLALGRRAILVPEMTVKARSIAAMVSSVAALAALACSACDGPDSTGEPRAPGTLTFNRDIAPIVFAACARCHHPGGSGPFSLLTYGDVKKRARQIVDVTSTRFMPPWLPEPGDHQFVAQRRLADEQIAALRRWVREGAVEGDPAGLPPPPQWTEGWQLGAPDLVVTLARPYTLAAEGTDVFRNFVIPVPVEVTRYVKAVELRPGNRRIVHHAVMQIDRTPSSRRLDERDAELGFGDMDMGQSLPPDGHFIGWTPGKLPFAGIDGMAWRLDRGTDLVLQLHMLPSGKPERIQPKVGFHFADERPTLQPMVIVLSVENIDIPAGTRDYTREDRFVLPVPVEVLSVYPHAHYLGKQIRGFATLPDGTRDSLIHITDWDFNWQDDYRYARSVRLPQGAALTMRYTYDNSSDNPRNPNQPPRRVRRGDRSSDEMGTMTLQVLTASPAERALLKTAWARDRLRNFPELPWTHSQLGIALLDQGEHEEAIRNFRRALEIEPAFADAHYNLGVALGSVGDWDEAIDQYRGVLRDSPDHVQACNNLGNALLRQGRRDEAISHFRRALKLHPYFEQAHYNLGVALGSQGRLDDAINHLRLALRIEPDLVGAHYHLANALTALGRLDEAVGHYRRAIAISPDMAETHYYLANALTTLGRLDEAISQYRVAIRVRPDYADASYNLASLLERRGDSEEAMVQYRRALEIDPNHPRAHYNLANALRKAGRVDDAVHHYGRVLEIDPAHVRAQSNLALALRSQGRVDEAVAHFREAIRIDPQHAPAHYNLAATLRSQGRIDEAVEHYRHAQAIAPDRPSVLSGLGAALAARGDLEESRVHLARALELATAAGNEQAAGAIRAQLEKLD